MTAAPEPSRLDPRLVDTVLALAMALVVAVVVAAGYGGEDRTHPAAYLFAAAFGALILLRRRAPRIMLVLTVLGIFGYYALDFPVIGMAFPAIAALYSAAELDRTGWAIGAGAVLVSVSTYFRIAEDQPLSYLYGWELTTNVALAAAAIALGTAVRQTRTARRQAELVAALTASEQERMAEQRLETERVRIARDLHDSVGHDLSVVALHAAVAEEAIGHDDEAARNAIDRVREATRASLRELRSTVRLLRTPGAVPQRGTAGIAAIDAVVRSAREAGLDVELRNALTAAQPGRGGPGVDPLVGAAAHRIVQESLTNVLRHAGASRAMVSLELRGHELRIQVVDDGQGMADDRRGASVAFGSGGQGIAGMRERATLLGGRLTAENRASGGFAVEAVLPAAVGSPPPTSPAQSGTFPGAEATLPESSTEESRRR